MTHEHDEQGRFNLARFFIRHRQLAWALLVSVLAWGVAGYTKMAKRKDPEIPVRVALAICPWPGITADRVEELVTRKIEQAASGNSKIEKIESTSRDGVAVVLVHLHESVADTVEQFADIGQRVTHIGDLPQGAGPVMWVSDFGDTAALMLTVASPKVGRAELRIRGQALRKAIEQVRAPGPAANRVSALYCLPPTVPPSVLERPLALFADQAARDGVAGDAHSVSAAGCGGLDLATSRTDQQLREYAKRFVHERFGDVDLNPDAWGPVFVRSPAEAPDRLSEVAGDLYTHRQLDDFTHEIERVLESVPTVAKVSRSGVLAERIFVDYAQERLATAKLQPSRLAQVLAARNTTAPGGVFDTGDRHVVVDPNVRDDSFQKMNELLLGASAAGTPVRLRDLAVLSRGYESPPRYLNFLVARDREGRWQRNRAITLAIQMRSGEQIGEFGVEVHHALEDLRRKFPPDLIMARTSDQPRQVEENVSLFMVSLYEAIFLVVIVSLVGFWNWRTAVLVAASIPLTLAMAFGAMKAIGVDIQQVSIATLIIALGLLVDMPVVAGDAIERELAEGRSRDIAAWMGPTRLARAIFFATVTNVVAYLPFLMLSGDTGKFLHTLPVVMTITLVAALIVSMSFIPLIALGLLRAPSKPERSIEERRRSGFTGWYARVVSAALRRHRTVLAASLLLLAGGGLVLSRLKTQFFPTDLSYLSYVDVWVPEDAPLAATDSAAAQAERIIREEAEAFGRHHGHKEVLRTLTTFVGGAGPRFWFSIEPEQQQLNYAQIVMEVADKHFTRELVAPLQAALSRVPGARIDVRQLETGKPVGIPVSLRVSGEDIATLRRISGEVANALRAVPVSTRVRDNWGPPGMLARLAVDDDRANLSGVTRLDVALSAAAAVSGIPVGTYREGDRQIPILARLRLEDRARLSELSNVYVFSSTSPHSVPLRQVAQIERELTTSKVQRRNQVRTITVSAYPLAGYLPSEVLSAARPAIDKISARLPPGYRLDIGGEYDEQQKGFAELALVMAASVALIYFALAFQFDSAVKPFLVFAAIPYGMVGAVAMLAIMHQPFGFMAFLGVASLIGVIVSHVIVLFDFIEEAHHRGRPLEDALIEAGIVRLRPVLITVGATVLGLVPLAMHGGPLWEPLCYAQIGGLTIATAVTLILVPLLYTLFVRDLRIVRWEPEVGQQTPALVPPVSRTSAGAPSA
ncbi:MAG TPA: efflux RND transporter permease subunit [Anaeromyxobacteraceae bacterium]|nr:efflux RND transporter permease subunit [Anaeromyxobacteraceae bacterium]